MSTARVRSRRSPWLVLGAGALASALAGRLRATHVPVVADAPTAALEQAGVVVAVGDSADLDLELRTPDRHVALAALATAAVALAAARGVPLVAVSSAMVCGAWLDRPPVDDDDPRAASLPDGPVGVVAGVARFEEALESAVSALPDGARPRVVVVRCAALAGGGTDTLLTRHFEAPRLLVVREGARTWQMLHVDDLAEGLRVAVGAGLTGTLTAGASVLAPGAPPHPDALGSAEVARIAGTRLVVLPVRTALAIAESLHRVAAVPSPAAELAFSVYPWTVTSRRLLAAGWVPRCSTADCVREIVAERTAPLTVAGRRVERRDAAALGAAGAAVALLGTAAAWRRRPGR